MQKVHVRQHITELPLSCARTRDRPKTAHTLRIKRSGRLEQTDIPLPLPLSMTISKQFEQPLTDNSSRDGGGYEQ